MNSGITILSLCVSESKNRENFTDIIDESLSQLDKTIRRRIVSCAIELIQNNLKYNTSEDIIVELTEEDGTYLLNTSRNLDQETCNMLIEKIEEINSTEHETLKRRFLSNLDKDDTASSTGNGLILCRLKSDDVIYTCTDSNKLYIRLKFNKINS